LWSDATAYDAGHFLMVPLHAAFALGRRDWEQEFSDHFTRFVSVGLAGRTHATDRLARAQYLYLASRFVVLAARANRAELIPPGLVTLLQHELENSWQRDSVGSWDRGFAGGLRERVDWKLGARTWPRSYYRAIDDLECYQFAIAADLRSYELAQGGAKGSTAVVRDVLDHARRAFEQRVSPLPDGGWLFQPGVWADHPDFLYAGQEQKVPGMPAAPLRDVAEDASHSFRFPLWLTSLIEAYPSGSADRAYYEGLRRGLARQFLADVLVRPTPDFAGYRITNFMDGRNGVYRWGYQGRRDWGVGPYELSASLTLGWWAFLADDSVRPVYRDLASRFPLGPQVLRLYVGGPTAASTRDPRRIIAESWADNLRELIVRLAALL
jgi:hypothetical protein